jgi:transcription initiation factor TFIID TATA-box-binding protein
MLQVNTTMAIRSSEGSETMWIKHRMREISLYKYVTSNGVASHLEYIKESCVKLPKVKATVNIENVVASATLKQRVDLNAVVKGYPGVEYRPEQFPGLVFRLKRPKTATLIFNSGKMVCTGAKSEKEARRAVMRVIKELKKSGIIIISKPELKIQNIVASASLGGMIDLEKSAYSLGRTMYEPEQFPGLIYRMDEPKVVILLFASGKLVCTGAKREEDVYLAVNKLHQRLEDEKLIYYE